jgi:hypothetical protein
LSGADLPLLEDTVALACGEAGEAGAWIAAMRAGAFEQAWAITDRDVENALRHGPPKHSGPRHLQRIWRGEPIAGRVLVRCYHGLGDTIQFARFLRPLRSRCREVVLWCQPELMPLMTTVAGVDRVLALHDGDVGISYDVDIEIMELPHALRAGRPEIAGGEPYIKPYIECAAEKAAAPVPGADRARRVGLVWQAGAWAEQRSIQASELSPLAQIPHVELVSLQRGPAAAEAHLVPARDESTPDLGKLAALLCRLDLVVSVDTMPAHLAGALGIPTWTLLHAGCDWRWPPRAERTIWYPTMRLFHQDRPGDWAGVVRRVAEELAKFAQVDSQSR